MPINYIFHISDIHIMEKNYINIKNSFSILVEKIIERGVDHSLLVIAGDVFESKSHLNTDDIFQWKAMCTLLKARNIKTLIICGNHDYNINSELVRDNISLLTTGYPNIVCVNKTEIKDGAIFGAPNIEFYIFSPIDKQIPKILSNNNIKIALLHEPVNAATYDNGETISRSRFNAANLRMYDYVLLGDIHLHQFLTERIAYCGSFVQKTRGEGIDKGYILWDLNFDNGPNKPRGKGTFHAIPLKEVYLTIYSTNDKCEIPESLTDAQKIRHLTYIYKDCSVKHITEIKASLTESFGHVHRVLNKNHMIESIDDDDIDCSTSLNGGVDMRKIINNHKDINHTNIIKDILGNDANIQDIIEHHSEVLRNRTEVTYTTYKLNYLYWSNILCYGENNYINFNEFSNDLVILNGQNKHGKSSIIDIIIRILFNECERGLKEDIVNKAKNTGIIKISFNIGIDEYVIEHVYKRASKTQAHRLYKNGTNITCDTIINTYKYLRETVGLGDYKDFVNMTTALQNRKFLVDMATKDLISLLTKITNIDILKDVEDETKKEITCLRALVRNARVRADSIKVVTEEALASIQEEQCALSAELTKTDTSLEIINKELQALYKEYDNTHIPDDINDIVLTSKDEVEKYKAYANNVKDHEKNTYVKQLNVLSTNLEKIKKSDLDIIRKAEFDITHIDKRPKLIADIKKLQDITYPSAKHSRDKAMLENIINAGKADHLDTWTPSALERCRITELLLLNIADKDEHLLNNFPDFSKIEKDIKRITHTIQKYVKNYSILTFDDSCVKCCNNKRTIHDVVDIDAEKANLTELQSLYDSRQLITDKYNRAKTFMANTLLNEICAKNKAIAAENSAIQTRIKEYNLAKEELKDYTNAENRVLLDKLREQEAIYEKYDIQQQTNEYIRLNNYKKFADAFAEFNKAKKLYDINITNGNKALHIKELDTKKHATTQARDGIINKINKITDEYSSKKNSFDNRASAINELNTHSDKLEFFNTYLKVINCKTGIPSIILKDTTTLITKKCNSILQKISDFTIDIQYDKDIKIFTVENDVRVHAQMASGMQKFVLDLIFRVILTDISCISCPKTIFIDEGFGALDKENFISVANILQKLKSNFDSMIIISHITELRTYVDKSMDITRERNLSSLQYGTLTKDQLYVHAEHEITLNNNQTSAFKTDTEILAEFSKEVQEYIEDNNGIESILFDFTGDKIYCRGCGKSYVNKAGLPKRHITASTYKKKHEKFILSLINNS